MTKEIFYYIVTIIIPSLFTLYSFGSIVFIIGEFKEQLMKVPHIFIILIIQLIFLGILQIHTFHYLFHNYIPENFYFISIFLNIYVIFEMIIIHKLSRGYLKFLNHNSSEYNIKKLNLFITKITKEICKHNIFFRTITEIYCSIIGFTLISMIIHNYSEFNLFLLIVFVCFYSTKKYLFNFISTLN